MTNTPKTTWSSWRIAILLVCLASLWGGVLWIYFGPGHRMESGEGGKGKEQGGPESLPPRIESLCKRVEQGRFGASRALRTDELLEGDDAVRKLVLQRAVAHALLNPKGSSYIPFLLEFRNEALAFFEMQLKETASAETAIELYCQLYLSGVYSEWAVGVGANVKRALFELLVHGLDKPGELDRRIVRERALGVVLNLKDPACLPWLRDVAKRETHLNARHAASRLVQILEQQRR